MFVAKILILIKWKLIFLFPKQVSNKTHGYLENVEHREEGGTPAITETIRLGLVFKFKDSLDHDLVTGLEDYYEK